MNDDQRIEAIIERLPSPRVVGSFQVLRRQGWRWADIEDRLDLLAEDIAESDMPFAHEADRYVKRLLAAAYAAETHGANN